jgi:hypothetical protein
MKLEPLISHTGILMMFYLLKKCPSKGDKYVIDEELQHTDHCSSE